jgi:hypothetical protein
MKNRIVGELNCNSTFTLTFEVYIYFICIYIYLLDMYINAQYWYIHIVHALAISRGEKI